MKKILLLLSFVVLTLSVSAQDKLYLRNGKVEKIEVIEIGDDFIRYKYFPAQENPLEFRMPSYKIKKLVLANGQTVEFQDQRDEVFEFVDAKRQAIKMGFVSPLFGYVDFYYENLHKPNESFEVGVGIIGVGGDILDVEPLGANFRLGYRIYTSSGSSMFTNNPHPLDGSYIKPEIVLTGFTRYTNPQGDGPWGGSPQPNQRVNVFGGALLLNFGWQSVFSDVFLMDISMGGGYGFTDFSTNDDFDFVQMYGFYTGTGRFPLALIGSVKIGLLTGKKSR